MQALVFDHNHSPMIGAYYFFKGDLGKAENELKILVETGINHLWLFIDEYFRKEQPGPRSDFDKFLKILEQENLQFAPVIGQFISLDAHPEIRIVNGDGSLSSDPRYWNMGCFRHPVNLEWATGEVIHFLQACKEHPLLCRINGKILMSFVHEAYYRTDTPEMGGDHMHPNCYCVYCIASFRGFLAARYKNLDNYNRLHQRSLRSWDEASPPLAPAPDPLLWLDWIHHHSLAIPEFLALLIKAARQEAPVISTHECNDFYPGSWQTVLTGNHIWRMAAELDIGHEDMYPLEFDQQYQIYVYAFMKDVMKSAMDFTRPYTGNGQAFTPWVVQTGLPENSMIEQVYTSLIHEAAGLVWWLGGDLDLWRKLKEPNAILKHWLPRLATLEAETPQIALFYSYNTLALAENDWHTLDLQLIYMALRQIGIPVDVITEDQLMQGVLGRRKYRVVLLPGVTALETEIKDLLLSFMQEGGTIIADYCGGGYAPFTPFTPLLTLRENRLPHPPRYYKDTGITATAEDLFIPVESPFTGVPVFEPGQTPRVLAVFDTGAEAVVAWNYGQGQMIGLGSLLGIDFANYPGHIHLNKMFPFLVRMNNDARKFLKLLCRECGISPAAESANPGLELGIFQDAEQNRLCLAVNHLPEAMHERIFIPGASRLIEAENQLINAQGRSDGLLVEVQLRSLTGTWFRFT